MKRYIWTRLVTAALFVNAKYWKKHKRMVNILTIEYYATVRGRKRQREERREESELYK